MLILNKRDSLFWKFVEYVFYVFVVLFPLVTYKSFLFGGTSSRSANLILLSIVLGIGYAIWLFKKGNSLHISKSFIPLSISIYFLFLVVSGLIGQNFSISFWSVVTRTTGIWYLLSLGFVVHMLWAVFSDKVRQNRLILTVVISTAVYSLGSFLSLEGLGILFKGYNADAFTFGNSTFAGMYIFGAFLLSLYYLIKSEHKKWWMYLLPILLVINPNIISSGFWRGDFSGGLIGEARASTYVLILSIIGLFVFWLISKIKNVKAKSITVYSIFSISLIVMILSAFSLLSHDGYLRKAYLSTATGARPLVWEMSEKIIAEKPYLGWGSDNFERIFELNYDNRLLQDEYGNEAWFDRAHNVFVDQLVDNGFVGLTFYILMYVAIILSLIYVTLKSTDKEDRLFASILILYFSLHFMELQTAFDTSISYFILAIMLAFSMILFDRTRSQSTKEDNEWDIDGWLKYTAASAFTLFFAWSFIWGWIPFVRAEAANGQIRTAGSSEKRIPIYETLLGSSVDQHTFIWRSSTDLQKAISENPSMLQDVKKADGLRKEIVVFENAYRDYILENPNHFRARLNLADMLIYQRLFGVDKLEEAQKVLDEAISIVPQAPQPYWMKAVAYIYMKKFDLAREYAQKGLELNPLVKQSQNVVSYVEKSIKSFPEIDLYFFKQI